MEKAKVDDARSAYSEHKERLEKGLRELLQMEGSPNEEPPNDPEQPKADEKPGT